MSDDIFGQSNYGGNYVKRNWYKLKDGEVVFRILPALGDLAKEGRWSVFWKVHYGYKNSAGQLRTFESPLVKNNKTKMIEVPDAASARIDALKAKFEEAKKSGNTALAQELDKLVGQKGQFNLDSNHYMNVMDQAGNIGILKIRHRAKIALDAEIKRLRGEGIDPLSPDNGRFLVFRRTGMGLDTTFKVDVLQETLMVDYNGEKVAVKRDVVSKLTPDVASRCASRNSDGSFRYIEAANLLTLYKKPTAEQVSRIVLEGARAVDEIFDTKAGTTVTDAGAPADEGEDDYVAPKAEAPKTGFGSGKWGEGPWGGKPTEGSAQSAAAATQSPADAGVFATTPPPAAKLDIANTSAEDFLKGLGL